MVTDEGACPTLRRGCLNLYPPGGAGVMTTGTTRVLSPYLTVILAFPGPAAVTAPSLDTTVTSGRSEV